MTFGFTVQELIDVLNELSPEEKTMYIVGDKDVPFNTVVKHWSHKKYLGNCIKVSGQNTVASTLPEVGK